MAEASSLHGHQGEEEAKAPTAPLRACPVTSGGLTSKGLSLRGHFRSRLQHYRLKISAN